MHTSGMEDLLLFVSSSDDHRQYAFHVLEIISLIFKEQVSGVIASNYLCKALSLGAYQSLLE